MKPLLIWRSHRGSASFESMFWAFVGLLLMATFTEFMIAFHNWQTLDAAKWAGLKVMELDGGYSPRVQEKIDEVLQQGGIDPAHVLPPTYNLAEKQEYGTDLTVTLTYRYTFFSYITFVREPRTLNIVSAGHTTSEYRDPSGP